MIIFGLKNHAPDDYAERKRRSPSAARLITALTRPPKRRERSGLPDSSVWARRARWCSPCRKLFGWAYHWLTHWIE
jgi:hypothetical protein